MSLKDKFFENNFHFFCTFQVLMMVLPLLLIMILPKMMNDPETRKARIFFIEYNVYLTTCYHRYHAIRQYHTIQFMYIKII